MFLFLGNTLIDRAHFTINDNRDEFTVSVAIAFQFTFQPSLPWDLRWVLWKKISTKERNELLGGINIVIQWYCCHDYLNLFRMGRWGRLSTSEQKQLPRWSYIPAGHSAVIVPSSWNIGRQFGSTGIGFRIWYWRMRVMLTSGANSLQRRKEMRSVQSVSHEIFFLVIYFIISFLFDLVLPFTPTRNFPHIPTQRM